MKQAGVGKPGLGEEGGEGDAGGQRLLVVQRAVQGQRSSCTHNNASNVIALHKSLQSVIQS